MKNLEVSKDIFKVSEDIFEVSILNIMASIEQAKVRIKLCVV